MECNQYCVRSCEVGPNRIEYITKDYSRISTTRSIQIYSEINEYQQKLSRFNIFVIRICIAPEQRDRIGAIHKF